MPGYRVESCAIKDPEEIEKEWLELQDQADCSFFQSWGWIGTWLEQIAIDLQPIVVKCWSDGDLVGIGIFVSRCVRRHYVIRSRAMFLNEYPFANRNMVIEYNGLLAHRGLEKAVYAAIVGYLLGEYTECDEFHFGAIADESFKILESCASDEVTFVKNEEATSWQLDLSEIPLGLNGYLGSLSRNRRGQIRRSLRLYEELGPLRLDVARNVEEALAFLDGLKVLHTQRWRSRGKQGAFGNPQWEAFHRVLIRGRFEEGEIQLLKVSNSHSVLGYLYNFVWRKNVYVVQSGFRVSADKRLMPGYVVHSLAIAYNKAEGHILYDFMYGDSMYKRIIGNRTHGLYWAVLQRHRLKFGFEKLMVGLVRRYRNVSSKR